MNTSTPHEFPQLLQKVNQAIESNAEAITELDQAIGDGDHVFNLQRGLSALTLAADEIAAQPDWSLAFQKMGMIIMSTIGGASGSLYATLFIALSKGTASQPLTRESLADGFIAAVDAVKHRGKADAGEKTMLDVLIPVSRCLKSCATEQHPSSEALRLLLKTAEDGVESTRNMIATKGRASFLGERSIGHLDAGAKTSQLMIATLAQSLWGED